MSKVPTLFVMVAVCVPIVACCSCMLARQVKPATPTACCWPCRALHAVLQRYIAAIACLKRALYLDPFEWLVAYNLGLLHLSTGQAASAFHYFSTAVNHKPEFAHRWGQLSWLSLGPGSLLWAS
eukprot:GHRQ01015588.1.p2 GENE.GHRQ01015588.1~~GHRQ01015588.1.p2  ORF type:complete len:124 (-),score=42.01 GHRQ01015588.1:726-1097(-)